MSDKSGFAAIRTLAYLAIVKNAEGLDMAASKQIFFASVLVLSTGCYQGLEFESDIETTRKASFNAISINGISINGLSINGLSINGLSINGLSINGISINGISINGISINGISINGSELTATYIDGGVEVTRSGEDMIGAEWDLHAVQVNGQGQEVTEDFMIRIDDVMPDARWDDVLLYDFSYRPKLGDTWKPLCADALGNPIPATVLPKYWDLKTGDRIDDPTVFSIACTNAVLAKCIEWGYRPWATATRCESISKKGKGKNCSELSLEDHHQACTRMVRADYCGNGEPWTVPGTPIDVWDGLHPQIEARSTQWTVEAEWTVDGALCLNDIRQQGWKADGKYPKCFLDKKGNPMKFKDCGSMKKNRSLLGTAFDKYNEGVK